MEERLPLPVESSKITKDCFRWCRVIFGAHCRAVSES